LQANKDAGYNNQDFKDNGKPVLLTERVGKAPKDHSEPLLVRLKEATETNYGSGSAEVILGQFFQTAVIGKPPFLIPRIRRYEIKVSSHQEPTSDEANLSISTGRKRPEAVTL
jgi:hypothetical protein